MKKELTTENINLLILNLGKKYPELSKRDLSVQDNDIEQMLTMVAYKLRKSKEEMSLIVEAL